VLFVGQEQVSVLTGNQLLTEDSPFASDTVTNTYVNRLRTALSLQRPTGAWTNAFGYDAAKRLTNVTSPAGAFAYQLAATVPSRLSIRVGLPNTAYITNVYDSVARLTGTYLKNSGNSVLDSYAYITGLTTPTKQVNRKRTESSRNSWEKSGLKGRDPAQRTVNECGEKMSVNGNVRGPGWWCFCSLLKN